MERSKLLSEFFANAKRPEPIENAPPAPVYEPEIWNRAPKLANCLGYAMNTLDWGELPFRRTDKTPVAVKIFNEVVKKGLIPAGQTKPEPVAGYYLVAVTHDENQWHVLREDADGTFSQKDGERPVTNLDDAGNVITDPAQAQLNSQKEFIGYFYARNKELTNHSFMTRF